MSKICLYLSILIILFTHFCYYPKWEKTGTEATISWDVSGYYMYLPAMFIYEDLKTCQFQEAILTKYSPTPDFHQAFIHEKSGNYVMKYSIGQAIVFLPFFTIGHCWALNDTHYLADGFSFPYQFLISLGMLLIAILGLYYLRKSLLTYFSERTTALSMLGIVLGTNYLNYASIDGAMTHNSLFTIYSLLIWLTIQFYKKPSLTKSVGIGICVGLAALIRPTEIISSLIPILWGVNIFIAQERTRRLYFIKSSWSFYAISILITLAIGTIQLIYWKYVSGDWIVYSYQDQGFSWLSPHFRSGLFSFRSGWLVYTPFMLFALLGFIPLYRNKKSMFYPTLIFFLVFCYITFAWDIWWYGGSLGQRAMVQAYPILAFPLCALIDNSFEKSRLFKAILIALSLLFIYANIWFTHQAHRGGLLYAGHMTRPYFFKTLFRYEHNPEDLKLLDKVDELYTGKLVNKKIVYADSSFLSKLNGENQYSEVVTVDPRTITTPYDRLRIAVDASIGQKEWNFWKMTQFIVELNYEEKVIDNQMIRLQRHLVDGQTKQIYMDIKKPSEAFTSINVKFWNGQGQKPITISNLSIDIYNDE